MNIILLTSIAAGGALGAVARYLLGGAIMRFAGSGLPYGTLAVNVLGSLAIGLVVGWFMRDVAAAKPAMQAFVITGFLGGFTTFSAFSLETVNMLQRGDYVPALSYIALSILLTLAACALGFSIVKAI